jgi:uncharacterized membrane protein (DUF106 family)
MEFLASNLFLVFIGLILWPRMLSLYAGLVPAMSIPPLFGFILVPRLYLAFVLSTVLWDSNPFFVIACWVIAAIIDVTLLLIKWESMKMTLGMMGEMQNRMREMQSRMLGETRDPFSDDHS